MWRNLKLWLVVAVVALLVVIARWPRSTVVDTAAIGTGPVVVTIEEDGRTRVRDRFVVTSPVAGEIARISLRPGDRVERGRTPLVVVRPAAPVPLDERSRLGAEALVQAAQAAVDRGAAELARVRALGERTRRDLEQARRLAAGGAIAADEVERRETEATSAAEAVRAAEFAVAQGRHDLEAARARVAPARGGRAGGDWTIVAPVDGVVLARHRESQAVVAPGEPLIEIGDPSRLEVVADVLSVDAVKIRPGMRVIIDEWGGDRPLAGRVRLVEPAGFTKVSALGVEEQRVNVVIDLDAASGGQALGDSFRVAVRVVAWEAADVLRVPVAALFRDRGAWAVYLVDAGVVRRRVVEIGHRDSGFAEITGGLTRGDVVVLYPPDGLADGDRVDASPAAETLTP